MTRIFFLLFFSFFLQSIAFGQLKKSLYGKYTGNIPAYEINTGTENIAVSKAPISIQLTSKTLALQIGNQSFTGTWKLLFEAKGYYVIEGEIDNQAATERIIIYKKGKKISREGLRPQPDAMLKKVIA